MKETTFQVQYQWHKITLQKSVFLSKPIWENFKLIQINYLSSNEHQLKTVFEFPNMYIYIYIYAYMY